MAGAFEWVLGGKGEREAWMREVEKKRRKWKGKKEAIELDGERTERGTGGERGRVSGESERVKREKQTHMEEFFEEY